MLRDRSRGRVADSGSKGYGDMGRGRSGGVGRYGYAVLLGRRRSLWGKNIRKWEWGCR